MFKTYHPKCLACLQERSLDFCVFIDQIANPSLRYICQNSFQGLSAEYIGCCILLKRLGLEVNVTDHMGMAAENNLRQRFTWERFPGPRWRKDWRERRFHPSNTSVKLWSGFCTLLFIYEKIPRHFQTSFHDSTPYQSNIFVVIEFFLPFLQISRGPISPELKSSTRFT